MGHGGFRRGGGGRRGGRGGRGGRGRGGRQDSVDFRSAGYNDGVPSSVDESVVGIQSFLKTDVSGFHGATKQRFSDFVVHEVALDGRIVTLSDVKRFVKPQKLSEIFKHKVYALLIDMANEKMEIPAPIITLVGKLAGKLLGTFNANKRATLVRQKLKYVEKVKESIAEICGQEVAENLASFMQKMVDLQVKEQEAKRLARIAKLKNHEKQENDDLSAQVKPERDDAFYFQPIQDKKMRTAVHDIVREFGSDVIVADTTKNNDGVPVIRVRSVMVGGLKRKDMDQRSEKNSRNSWPKIRPDYLEFVLYKRNLETNSAMLQLAKALNSNVSAFTYAGTKDKRGITTQLVTVYHGSKEQLETLNPASRELDSCNFIVGNAKYVSDRLHLGDLRGNRFSMAIRDLPDDDTISDEQIHNAVRSWSDHGFINYFGLQRFGTKAIATHEIGRALLQRDFSRVVSLLISPQQGDATKIFEARKNFLATHDVEAALKALPPYLVAERAVLHGLRTHGLTAYAKAIQSVPRHLRMMYTHSYQSYVWNLVASERLTRMPRNAAVVGDLVIPHDTILEENVEDTCDNADLMEEAVPKAKKPRIHPRSKANVTLVTKDNLSQYTIYDVVLPLPGYDVTFPENAMKKRYEDIMKADSIDFQALKRATNSEYHLPGSYRHVLKKPLNVEHEIKRFNDPTLPLLRTDVDHLLCRPARVSIPDGKYRALCLTFQLGPSSYATMAVRELLKQSSNLDVQLQLKQKLDAQRMNKS
ncbi:trna pseudouridine synthase d [Plasmopara halstedii]|uniref:Trna pseudouridine synthase d n=1 Tax=Plasmopara halstedii TaxID=4781 RepID=A0A0P1AQP5_PLAHL|nr:trna pseudouridine synthase d [Plasmopara halstedii]CEG43712.1 trna pseudouridine synthase d [Plasmopara halstedii]|eukprot:XP_024580081.1 trna pseudouridine synthase d [Plasmopara halstedii]